LHRSSCISMSVTLVRLETEAPAEANP